MLVAPSTAKDAQMRRFVTDKAGVTAIEYGMIAALVAAVIVANVGKLGFGLSGTFAYLTSVLPPVVTGGGG